MRMFMCQLATHALPRLLLKETSHLSSFTPDYSHSVLNNIKYSTQANYGEKKNLFYEDTSDCTM